MLVLRKNSEASSMSMLARPTFVSPSWTCPGSAKAQYLTVSSCRVWDPFFMSAFFTNQHSHPKKKQGTPCTPRQCHKAPQKVPRATPASIFGGIRHHLGIQTATQLLSYSSLTKPENVWPSIGRWNETTSESAPGACTSHQSPWSARCLQGFCHRVILQRSRKCLENTKRHQVQGSWDSQSLRSPASKMHLHTKQKSFVKLSWGSGHWQNGCQVDTKKGVIALTP